MDPASGHASLEVVEILLCSIRRLASLCAVDLMNPAMWIL